MATAETDTTHAENASAGPSAAEKDAFVRLLQAVKAESEKGEQLLALVTAGGALGTDAGLVSLGSIVKDLLSDFCRVTGYCETGAVPENLPVPRDLCAEEHEDVGEIVAQLEAENQRVRVLVTRTLSAFAEFAAHGDLGFPEILPHIYPDAVRYADQIKVQPLQFDGQQASAAELKSALDVAREELASQALAMERAKTAHQFAYDAVQQELESQRRVEEDLKADFNAAQKKLAAQQRLADERLEALEAAQRKIDEQQRVVEGLNAALAQARGDLESHRRVSEEAMRDACDQLSSRHQQMHEKLESEHFAVDRSWQERCDLLEKRCEEWKQKSRNDTRVSEKLLHDFNSVTREFHELKGKVEELTAADQRVSAELQGMKDIDVRLLDQLQKSRFDIDSVHVASSARGQEGAGRLHKENRSEASIEESEVLLLKNQLANAHREKQAAENRLREELEDKERQLAEVRGIADELANIAEQEQEKSAQIGIEHAECREDLLKARKELEEKALEVITLKEENRKFQIRLEDHIKTIQESGKQISLIGIERAKYHEDLWRVHEELEAKIVEAVTLKDENRKLQNQQEDYVRSIHKLEERIAQLGPSHHQQAAGDLFVAPGASCPAVDGETTSAATTGSTTAESSPVGRLSRRDSFGMRVENNVRFRETEERLAAAEARNLELQRALEAATAARAEMERNADCINRSIDFFIQDSNEKQRLIVKLKQRCHSMKVLQTLGNKCQDDIQEGKRGESVMDSPGNPVDSVVFNPANIGDFLPDAKSDETIDQTVQATVEKTAENFNVLRQVIAQYEKDTEQLTMEKENLARTLKLSKRRLQEAQRDALRYRRKAVHYRKEMKHIEELIKASNQDYGRPQCPS